MGASESLFDGVSGLSNHQAWMEVIGNNIANVNTTGFKEEQFDFADVISQTLRGASSAVPGGPGGTDFAQVGLGTEMGSIVRNQQQGSLQTTNLPTDFAIQGDGFFIVNDGLANHYTRSSNYIVDGFGNINQASTGFHLQGYGLKQVGNAVTIDNTRVVNLTVPQQINPAQQTNALDLIGNLQSSSILPQTQSIGVYDSLGQLHNVVLTFSPSGKADGFWSVSATAADLTSGSVIAVSGGNATATIANTAMLHFNPLGQLDGTVTPMVLSYISGNSGTLPATTASPTQASQPWLIPGTTTASNAAQTATILNLNDPKVGNLTQFASPTTLSTQAAPDAVALPNGNGTVTIAGNLSSLAPTVAGTTNMGTATFVAQDNSPSAAPHTFQIGLVSSTGTTYTPQLLTVDGFSGAMPGTFNLSSATAPAALVPVTVQATDSTGQPHSFLLELSGDATGKTWGAFVQEVDGKNPLVTGSFQYGFGTAANPTTTVTFNKVEPDGINHQFALKLLGTDSGTTTTWSVSGLDIDGVPAGGSATFAQSGTVTISDTGGAIFDNMTVAVTVPVGQMGTKNAEGVTFDFSAAKSSTVPSTLAPDVAGPTAALKFGPTGAILTGSDMSVSIASNAMFLGNVTTSALEANAAQQFNFNFAQVTNTVGATSAPLTPVGFATLPGGTSALANVVFTGGTPSTPGTLTGGGLQTLSIPANAFDNGNTAQSLTLDFSHITNTAMVSGIEGPLAGSAGNSAGSLKDFTVDQHGVLHGVYTNGFTQMIGQILLATFENPGGLDKEGLNNLQISANSGVVNIGTPGSGRFGTLAEGNVETSNVDLATEFSNMILAERGFQANSRIITTSDDMLQEVVNLKRG